MAKLIYSAIASLDVLVGGGQRAFPDGVHLKLELSSQRRFGGMALLSLAAH